MNARVDCEDTAKAEKIYAKNVTLRQFQAQNPRVVITIGANASERRTIPEALPLSELIGTQLFSRPVLKTAIRLWRPLPMRSSLPKVFLFHT